MSTETKASMERAMPTSFVETYRSDQPESAPPIPASAPASTNAESLRRGGAQPRARKRRPVSPRPMSAPPHGEGRAPPSASATHANRHTVQPHEPPRAVQ